MISLKKSRCALSPSESALSAGRRQHFDAITRREDQALIHDFAVNEQRVSLRRMLPP